MGKLDILAKERIILCELNKDPSSWIHLMEHDKKRIASNIATALQENEDVMPDNEEFLRKDLEERNKASAEIIVKLELINKIGNLKDKLKKISWWKLNERSDLKFEILKLRGELLYG